MLSEVFTRRIRVAYLYLPRGGTERRVCFQSVANKGMGIRSQNRRCIKVRARRGRWERSSRRKFFVQFLRVGEGFNATFTFSRPCKDLFTLLQGLLAGNVWIVAVFVIVVRVEAKVLY